MYVKMIAGWMIGFGLTLAVVNWLSLALLTWVVSLKLGMFMSLMLYGFGAFFCIGIGMAVGYLGMWATAYAITLLSEWSIWLYKKIKGDKTYEHPQFGRVYDMTGNPLEAAF